MIHYSTREVEEQRKRLYREADSLPLTDWERNFLESVTDQTYPLTSNQKTTISKLYVQYLDNPRS